MMYYWKLTMEKVKKLLVKEMLVKELLVQPQELQEEIDLLLG